MGYYSVLKKQDTLTHTTTWMNSEDIMLSEINQPWKGKYRMIPFRGDPEGRRFIETNKYNGRCQRLWEGKGLGLMKTEFHLCKMKGILETEGGDGCAAVGMSRNATKL